MSGGPVKLFIVSALVLLAYVILPKGDPVIITKLDLFLVAVVIYNFVSQIDKDIRERFLAMNVDIWKEVKHLKEKISDLDYEMKGVNPEFRPKQIDWILHESIQSLSTDDES
jgi:hypothetical protein